MDRTIPMNEGAYRSINIIVPLGTFLNATSKCATIFGNGEMLARVGELIRICLALVTRTITAAAHVGTTRQCVEFGQLGGVRVTVSMERTQDGTSRRFQRPGEIQRWTGIHGGL